MHFPSSQEPASTHPHRRRPRYAGKYPRRFEEKYKEQQPERYAATVAKVIESGKTPAGTHRPVMVTAVLEALAPRPGEVAVDCTLGYGGHAQEILARLQPAGRLLGLDADPVELPKAEARLRGLGFGPETFCARQTNFAALPQVLADAGLSCVDIIFADLGVSSMQLDDPARGFSMKNEGPLDLRMNPRRGEAASVWLEKMRPAELRVLLEANADEPRAHELAEALAGVRFPTTTALAGAVRGALPRLNQEARESSVRRVFQALRIAVNKEFSALDALLRALPAALNPHGRVGILTFHSGEDRRVKKAFEAGMRAGVYAQIAREVLRPDAAERRANPRSEAAKLRWALKGAASAVKPET